MLGCRESQIDPGCWIVDFADVLLSRVDPEAPAAALSGEAPLRLRVSAKLPWGVSCAYGEAPPPTGGYALVCPNDVPVCREARRRASGAEVIP